MSTASLHETQGSCSATFIDEAWASANPMVDMVNPGEDIIFVKSIANVVAAGPGEEIIADLPQQAVVTGISREQSSHDCLLRAGTFEPAQAAVAAPYPYQ